MVHRPTRRSERRSAHQQHTNSVAPSDVLNDKSQSHKNSIAPSDVQNDEYQSHKNSVALSDVFPK